MNSTTTARSAKTANVNTSVSPKPALDQKWVIGRGWVNKADLALEEQEDAIREALKGDDQYQREADES
jgi:hypothetical protein